MPRPLLAPALLPALLCCLILPGAARAADGPEQVLITVTGRGLNDSPAVPAYDVRTLGRDALLAVASGRIEEVLAGVAEGERVVSSGNLLLDSQAQLNASVAPQAGPAPVSLAPATALKPGQESAVFDPESAIDFSCRCAPASRWGHRVLLRVCQPG